MTSRSGESNDAGLQSKVEQQQERIDELEQTMKKMMPSRRDMLKGGAVAGAGLLGFGAGQASADGHNDSDTQWGNNSNRDDYFVDFLDANSAKAGELKNASGDHRTYSAAATVYYEGSEVIALDRFGGRINSGTHEGGGGVNDDSSVIQAAIDHVYNNEGPNPRVNVVPNGAYVRLNSEVHVQQNVSLDVSGAQIGFEADVNGFFLDQGATLVANGTVMRPEWVSGYTSDAIVLDSSRTSSSGGDYFLQDKTHVKIVGFPLIYGTNGEGTMLALRADPNRIDAGIFADVLTYGGYNGVLFDTTGSYANANHIRGQFRNASRNIRHTGGENAASSKVIGTIGYGDYGIKNDTSQEGSIRFLGEFRDPHQFNTAATDGPGIRVDQPGDEQKTVSVTANYNAIRPGHFLLDASGGNLTLTLPQADIRGAVVAKRVDGSSNSATVEQNATGENIDGSTSVSLPNQYDHLVIKSDGSVWHQVGGNV